MFLYSKQNCDVLNSVITMGTFDGVHLGHQKLLKELVRRAHKANNRSVVITYYHHPLETIFRNTFPYLLTEIKKREELLRDIGIDCIMYLNFTSEMAEMSAERFLQEVICREVQPSEIVVGYDTHFGKDRQGSYDLLKAAEMDYNYKVDIVEPFRLNGKIVSSSWCRECIRAGAVDQARYLLGRSYSIRGEVVKGNRIGHQLGFPTVNIAWEDSNKLIPKNGIYLSRVKLADKEHWGVTNIGYRPTVIDKSDLTVETHILDFEEEIYGEVIEISFESRLRAELKLHGRNELKKYILHDIKTARELIRRQEQE